MEKYLVGFRRSDSDYEYVSSIGSSDISTTFNVGNGMDFFTKEMAEKICEYINKRKNTDRYIVLKMVVTEEK